MTQCLVWVEASYKPVHWTVTIHRGIILLAASLRNSEICYDLNDREVPLKGTHCAIETKLEYMHIWQIHQTHNGWCQLASPIEYIVNYMAKCCLKFVFVWIALMWLCIYHETPNSHVPRWILYRSVLIKITAAAVTLQDVRNGIETYFFTQCGSIH